MERGLFSRNFVASAAIASVGQEKEGGIEHCSVRLNRFLDQPDTSAAVLVGVKSIEFAFWLVFLRENSK